MTQLKMLGLVVVLGAAVACSDNPQSPAAPGAAEAGTMGAANEAAGGASLKVGPPTPQAPNNGDTLSAGERTTTLRAEPAAGMHVEIEAPHRFELYRNGELVGTQVVPFAANGVRMETRNLEYGKRYRWRVRAELDGSAGPWSSFSSFTTGRATEGTTTSSGGDIQSDFNALTRGLAPNTHNLVTVVFPGLKAKYGSRVFLGRANSVGQVTDIWVDGWWIDTILSNGPGGGIRWHWVRHDWDPTRRFG